MSSTADSEAIRLLRRRDPRGFDLAYQRYAGRLLGFLCRVTGQRPFAEDLLQQVFVRLAERGPALRADSDLGAWLFTVARNAYRSQLRKTPTWVDDAVLERLANPASDVTARLLLGDVERALGKLRVEDREVLLLIGVEQLERAVVAKLLEVDDETLRKRLSRARARLLAELEQEAPPISRDVKEARS
ncbi:MAG TPA: RNA polymerase sigma factor [Polyangiaceae bacterium]|nr:RNA polymerase sigma factor [Polyangiaceae bacterium]